MEQQSSIIHPRRTINSRGRIIDMSNPLIMGILNVTTDSFYSGSRYRFAYQIARRAEQILAQGGHIIDIGACSTRPGAAPVEEQTELKRLAKAVGTVRKRFPDAIISIDTYRANVARAMVNDYGAHIINDISAGSMDANMFSTVASLHVPYVLTHMQGTPSNMQQQPTYNNVISDLMSFFNQKIEELKALNVCDIIIDPGFGFGKTEAHNYTILRNLNVFELLGLPLLVGISRKSMIYKALNTDPRHALNGTTVLNTIALQRGANILRVHDVREAVETIALTNKMAEQPEFM